MSRAWSAYEAGTPIGLIGTLRSTPLTSLRELSFPAPDDRAGEQTLLLGAAYDLGHVGIDGLTLSTLVAIDTHVAEDLPMWSEYDFIASYDLSAIDSLPHWLSPLSLNAQYALLQSDDPDGDSNLSDELRLILNYELKSSGKDL